jgi:hypothetical protein
MFSYAVTGRLDKNPNTSDDDVIVTLTVNAKNVQEAIKTVHGEEPEIKITNVVRTLKVPEGTNA